MSMDLESESYLSNLLLCDLICKTGLTAFQGWSRFSCEDEIHAWEISHFVHNNASFDVKCYYSFIQKTNVPGILWDTESL